MTNFFQQWRFMALFLLFTVPFTAQAQWENMQGPVAGVASLPVADGNTLYVFNADDIYKSDDNGANWYSISQHLPKGSTIVDLQVLNNTIMILKRNYTQITGTSEIYTTQNAGQSWRYIPLPVAKSDALSALLLTDKIILSVSGLLYEFPFSDLRWRPAVLNGVNGTFAKFRRVDGKIYAFSAATIAKSSDEGQHWTVVSTPGLPAGSTEGFWVNGDTMFVTRYIYVNTGSSVYKSFRSINGGQSWSGQIVYQGLPVRNIQYFDGAWFGCTYDQLLVSFDGGINWQVITDAPDPSGLSIESLASGLYVLSDNGGLLYRTTTAIDQVFTPLQQGILGGEISGVYSDDSVLLVSAQIGGIHRYRKNAGTWSPQSIFPYAKPVGTITSSDNRLIASMRYPNVESAIYTSVDNGDSWNAAILNNNEPFTTVGDIHYIGCINHHCFAYNNTYQSDPEWFSTDNGVSWNSNGQASSDIMKYGNNFYRTAVNRRFLEVSSDGQTWAPLSSEGIDGTELIWAFYPLDHFICLWASPGADSSSLYYSEDNGLSWTFASRQKCNFIFPSPVWGKAELLMSRSYFGEMIYSEDKGVNWHVLPPNEQYIKQIEATDDQFLYGANKFLFRMAYSDRHYRQVKVTAFHDLNQNDIKEPGEPVLPGVLVRVPQAGYLQAVDSTGAFEMTLNIAPGSADTVWVSAPQSFHLTPTHPKIPVMATDSVVYAAFTNTTTHDLGVYMGQTKPLLAGHGASAIAVVKNTGGSMFSGAAQLKMLVPDLLTGGTIVPAPDGQSGDTLLWDIPSLLPDSTLLVTFRFMSPENPVWNDHYFVHAWIAVPQQDAVAKNDTTMLDIAPSWVEMPYWNFVNQSTVALQKVKNRMAGLSYCSGFANLFALPFNPVTNVFFQQQFRADFDLSTLRIIASSYPVSVRTSQNESISFYMETPPLPDTSMGEASRCFVLYTIDPMPEVAHHDLIAHTTIGRFNTGTGYGGDTNMAITLVEDGPVAVPELPDTDKMRIVVSPNPSNGTFRIDTGGKEMQNALLTITDSRGKQCYSARWNGGEVHTRLAPGVYMVQLGDARAVRVTIF